MIQLVLLLHECDDPTPAESVTAAESMVVESTGVESAVAESIVEPLHSVVNSVAASAAPTETS
jgi:hypothetical protein